MEVTPAEAEKIKSLINEWLSNERQELEATFGYKGVVDSSTFLAVSQRLTERGFKYETQPDRMTIILPERIRFTLNGSGVIQQYCRDDTLEGKEFIAIIKDKASRIGDIDLKEYNVRIKTRREEPLVHDSDVVINALSQWKNQKKAFRIMKRWTFKGNGLQFDLSLIRSTYRDQKGDYKWVRSFREQPILKAAPTYEIEVELHHASNITQQEALKIFVSGIGEVLKGVQKNNILIRKTIKDKVLQEYTALTGDDSFRGVQPVTLEMENFKEEINENTPNIRTGYNVTEKADGLRCMGYCNNEGELFLIDNGMNVYRTGLKKAKCKNTLVDGEWVTKDKNGEQIRLFLIFDIYYGLEKVKTSTLPFREVEGVEDDSRYRHMKAWEEAWNEDGGPEIVGSGVNLLNKLNVSVKNFEFGKAGDNSIFIGASNLLSREYIYHTDGLIFTSNVAKIPDAPGKGWKSQFKWKPAEENTIDFLVIMEKDPEFIDMDKVTSGIHPETGEILNYKTMRLYVGSKKSAALINPQVTVLYDEPLPDKSSKYKPILFTPPDFTTALSSVAYGKLEMDSVESGEFIMTEVTNEPIYDRSIVEMRYDPKRAPGWRWIPIRVRHDKTEKFQKGKIDRTLNSDVTAQSVWSTIHNPITKYMITTGSEIPLDSEMEAIRNIKKGVGLDNVYYDAAVLSEEDIAFTTILREFHNEWIKNTILYKTAFKTGVRRLIDVACGKAGDLYKWKYGAKFQQDKGGLMQILGIDYSASNIRDPVNGAYQRYLSEIIKYGKERTPKCLFAIGDSTKTWSSGEAGMTPEDSDMLRHVFGKTPAEGAVPPYVNKYFTSAFREGADLISCMFALHYMFESKEKLDKFIDNLAENLVVGGLFIGCCFDGDKVFNMLRKVKQDAAKIGKEGDAKIWSITKRYDAQEFHDDETSIGLPVDVFFMSIGTENREYLVSFPYFVKRMKEIGCEVLSDKDARQYGLAEGTGMFEFAHQMAANNGKVYEMPESLKEYSFLNRWFIFKRVSGNGIELDMEHDEEVQEEVPLNTNIHDSIDVTRGERAKASQMLKIDADKTSKAMSKANVQLGEADAAAMGATVAEPQAPNKYTVDKVFRIGETAVLRDQLKINKPNAARYLAPIQYANIIDTIENDEGVLVDVIYPSVEHYILGMKFKHAVNRPDLAIKIASVNGSIYTKYKNKRDSEKRGTKDITDTRKHELMLEELAELHKATNPSELKLYGVKFYENVWSGIKDKVLREGLEQRYKTDKAYKDIIDTVRSKGMYVLYSSYDNNTELGGKHAKDGSIAGGNKVGRMMMEIAAFKI
jgi:hypothetical protein